MLFLVLLLLLLGSPCSWGNRFRRGSDPTARTIRVHNFSGNKIGIYWIDLMTEERYFQMDVLDGAIQTFYTHTMDEFELQERPNRFDGECGGKKGLCRSRYFQVNQNDDQLIFLRAGLKLEHTDNKSVAKKAAKATVEKCRKQYLSKTTTRTKQEEEEGEDTPTKRLNELAECVGKEITTSLSQTRETIAFESDLREKQGNRLLNYACHDPSLKTSKHIYEQLWNPFVWDANLPNKIHEMEILLETDANMILMLKDFVDPAQCQAVLEKEDQQHTVRLNPFSTTNHVAWEASESNDFVRNVVTRMYALMGQWYGVSIIDQDVRIPLFQIHRDWTIDGTPPTTTLMVPVPPSLPETESSPPILAARMVIFCDEPQKGGAIHFPETGIHIQPRAGTAVLINYINPTTRAPNPEDGLKNKHVECPVLEGNRTTLNHFFFVPSPPSLPS